MSLSGKSSSNPNKPNLKVVRDEPGGGTSTQPKVVRMKKGNLIFQEGDNSRAMYFLKEGMVRIFKKKGQQQSIELDTIRTGQVLGELAFLDGNPRSASGECLTECTFVEISSDAFTQQMGIMPEWLKVLLKTIVGRLRTASTKIKQLESSSSEINYSGKTGSKTFVYLSTSDALKVGATILLVASRYPESQAGGVKLNIEQLQKFGNQIFNIPVAKITSFVDILVQVGIIQNDTTHGFILKDIQYLEDTINFISNENLLESSKKKNISIRMFLIMNFIIKHISKYTPNSDSGLADVNLQEIINLEKAATGKEPFRLDEIEEFVGQGIASQVAVKDAGNATTSIKVETFKKLFEYQKVIKCIDSLNLQKQATQK